MSLISVAALILAMAPLRAPTEVVEAMLAAFNAHDARVIAKLYAPEARLTSSDFCAPRGQRDVVRTYQPLFDAMPDLHDTIETITVAGDRVTVHFIAASQTAGLSLKIVAVLEVRDGLIVRDDSRFETDGQPCTP